MKTYCLVSKNYTDNSNSRVIKYKCVYFKNMFTSKGSRIHDSLGLNTPQNRMKTVLWNAFR